MSGKQEYLNTINNLGTFIQYWGFKSVHGKIWGFIYLSEEPVSTPQIVEFLGVSKGLVSVAINELLEYKLIVQLDKAKYGALTYVAASAPASTVREVLKNREIQILKNTESSLKALSKLNAQSCRDLNLSKEKAQELLGLTSSHRNLLSMVVKKNVNSVSDWRKLLERGLKFLKLGN
ncbi:MAG: hypothetical protein CME64_01150 [Halobacteriovoraceae bacterium]|nr:hypothetical protein [Halobacteriovoraceae bacterium]